VTDGSAESAAQTLAELAPRLGRVIANALESDPQVALSLRQYRMLERLAERPHRTGELASTSDVSQPTASAAVASLETRGLVARGPDPLDRRATLVEISSAGVALFATAKARVMERLSIVTAEMTDADSETLRALQPILIKGMDRLRDHLRAAPRR
jgi:DNA-binding MarR family transcriptional regulator